MTTSGKKKKEKKSTKKSTDPGDSEPLSAAALAQSQKEVIKNHGKAENTRKAYDRYVEQGKYFLEKFAWDEEESNSGNSDKGSEVASINATNAVSCVALDGMRNEWSPETLELFITQKCIEGGLGQSTADGI